MIRYLIISLFSISFLLGKEICVDTIVGQDNLVNVKVCGESQDKLLQKFQEDNMKKVLFDSIALSQEKKMIISHQKTHNFIEKDFLGKVKKTINITNIKLLGTK